MQQEPPQRSECKGSQPFRAFLTAKPSHEAELNASPVLPVPHGRCPSSWCFRTSPSLRSHGNSSHQRMEPRTACLDELARGLHGDITVTLQHMHSWSAREILRSWYFLLKCSLSSPSPLGSEAPRTHGRFWYATETQNGRGWKGPQEIILSNPLLKKGYLELVAQDCAQTAFEYQTCPSWVYSSLRSSGLLQE